MHFNWRPRNDEDPAELEIFSNFGEFVIARLADRVDGIKCLLKASRSNLKYFVKNTINEECDAREFNRFTIADTKQNASYF